MRCKRWGHRHQVRHPRIHLDVTSAPSGWGTVTKQKWCKRVDFQHDKDSSCSLWHISPTNPHPHPIHGRTDMQEHLREHAGALTRLLERNQPLTIFSYIHQPGDGENEDASLNLVPLPGNEHPLNTPLLYAGLCCLSRVGVFWSGSQNRRLSTCNLRLSIQPWKRSDSRKRKWSLVGFELMQQRP